jgi:hypothetical protein
MIIDPGVFDLSHLPDLIDKVEFKGTVVDGDLAAVEAMLAAQGVPSQDGEVYFFDTKALALFDHDVLLRARVIGDDRESTVKLRPAATAVAVAARANNEKVKVELDIAGQKQSLSAKLDKKRDPGEIEAVAAAPGTVPALFSDKQRDLMALHAPGAPALDVLRVLGPVVARKWELPPTAGFPYKLAVEKWVLDDAMQFIELSIKVDRDQAAKAQADFLGLLADRQLHVTNEQKTPLVLRFFAARLAG